MCDRLSEEMPVSIPNSKSPLLDQVTEPADLRSLADDQLQQLADELRADTVDSA